MCQCGEMCQLKSRKFSNLWLSKPAIYLDLTPLSHSFLHIDILCLHVDSRVLLCAFEAYISVCGLHHGCEFTTKYECLPNAGSCQLPAREICSYFSKSQAFYCSPSSWSLSLPYLKITKVRCYRLSPTLCSLLGGKHCLPRKTTLPRGFVLYGVKGILSCFEMCSSLETKQCLVINKE